MNVITILKYPTFDLNIKYFLTYSRALHEKGKRTPVYHCKID